MARLIILGSSDSQGVPRWFCRCSVCTEARTTGLNARTRSSALLENNGQRVLLDAAPEFRLQATRFGVEFLDAVIISHAHSDHILGLGDVLGRPDEMPNLKVFAPANVLEGLRPRFPYLFERLPQRFHEIDAEGINLAGYKIRAFAVPHGFNGMSFALHFNGPKRFVYCTDALDLSEALLEEWFLELDLLVLGTSFWQEHSTPRAKRSVYDVQEALELIKRIMPRHTVLAHLGHDVDTRRNNELPHGVELAKDGLSLEL